MKARDLSFRLCDSELAVAFVGRFHSLLPTCHHGPWRFAFEAHFAERTLAVALWNDPSCQDFPRHWLELARLAVCPQAPRYTCSRFLGWMVRYLRRHCPAAQKLLSYQDLKAHRGTIYQAAGWHFDYVSARGKARWSINL